MPPIPGLAEKLNTIRSRHIPIWMYFQTAEQINRRYGEPGRSLRFSRQPTCKSSSGSTPGHGHHDGIDDVGRRLPFIRFRRARVRHADHDRHKNLRDVELRQRWRGARQDMEHVLHADPQRLGSRRTHFIVQRLRNRANCCCTWLPGRSASRRTSGQRLFRPGSLPTLPRQRRTAHATPVEPSQPFQQRSAQAVARENAGTRVLQLRQHSRAYKLAASRCHCSRCVQRYNSRPSAATSPTLMSSHERKSVNSQSAKTYMRRSS